MRRERFVKRLLALVLAFSMVAAWAVPARAAETRKVTFTQVDNSAVSAGLPGRDQVTERPDTLDYDADEVVRVSIVLEKKGTIEAGYDIKDIAWNKAAVSYREGLEALQNSLVAKINQAIQGQLDVVWNLTLAANIISANVEYGQIETIKAMDGIQDVLVETCYEPAVINKGGDDPNMATSSKQIGSTIAWASGYTGAGSRIAIIDTGIDKDHLSFDGGAFEYSLAQLAAKAGVSADEYIAGLDLLDAEEITAVADQLNVNISADQAYVSTKIPFGYNYVDEDYEITHMTDNQEEHGSHVTGIAAANAYVPEGNGYVSALDSVLVQGVAPDAQILTMKVFGKNGGAYDSDYMAAIEDAIVLGADSINLSLGSGNPGMSGNSTAEYQAILDSLVHSGVVVTMSAGNSGSWVENAYNVGYLYSDDVSMDTVGSPGSFTNSLGVASVDNDGSTGAYFTVDGTRIFYTETSGINEPLSSIAGEHEYVLIDGYGTEEDWAAVGSALEGKIAVCSRGTTSFFEKANAAISAGAIATIIYNNQAGSISMNLSGYEYTAPCVSILQSEGDLLRDAATAVTDDESNVLYYTGTLTVGDGIASTQYNSDYYTMSSFSSWGVPGSLELKPEITAPGGSIYSVAGAYADGIADHESYEKMSGTSMAAPQVAGMAAVVAQYIRENGLEDKTGLDARTLAQSLLMSTAEPIFDSETEYYYPVIQQGAGLANVGNAVTADSYILMGEDATASYADGKVKAELGDDPDRTGEYSFSFTINNLTDVDKAYTLSADFFTQDVFKYYANGNQSADEMALYMDTWTVALAANVSWTVDGKPAEADANLTGMDFNGDGIVDADDGQALLDYATGVRTELTNAAEADQNGDGDIDSYDAYLFLSSLSSGSVQVPANGSVTVRVTVTLPEDQKEELDTYYPNGAYIEGYVYASGVASDEGEAGTTHSIPVLGFYGNWSDPSMFDVGSQVEYAHGEEIRTPYLDNEDANAFSIIYGDGSGDEYYFGGNPVVADEIYLPERNAISADSQFAKIYFTSIRNAAASMATVANLTTGQLLIGEELGSVYSAFYYVNGGSWQYVNRSLNLGLSPADLEGDASEGDTLEVGLTLAPEYYVDGDGNVDWDALGEGATFSITAVIDNTAPVLSNIAISGNTLTVTASDNQYIAAVALFDEFGEYLYTYEGADLEAVAGATSEYSLDLTDVDGAKFLLQVFDYAMNTATYEINEQIGDVTDAVESVDISSESLVLKKGTSAKLTASVMPVNATDRSITWTSSDETVATVDENGVVIAIEVGTCTITATSNKDNTVSASCQVDVIDIKKELNAVIWDEYGEVWWSAFNTDSIPAYEKLSSASAEIPINAVAYGPGDVLYATTLDTSSGAASLYTVDESTFELTKVGDSSIFYADITYSPLTDYLIGAYGPYVVAIDETTGDYLGAICNEYTNYIVAITYAGTTQMNGTLVDLFYLIDQNGELFVQGFDGQYYYFDEESGDCGSTGISSETFYFHSAYYDGQFMYFSNYNKSGDVVDLYVLDVDDTGSIYDMGSFAASVWPVAGLFELNADAEGEASEALIEKLAGAEPAAVDNIVCESIELPKDTNPAGGLNSVAAASGSQTRPLSVGSASEDGKTVTVTVTAKDAAGADVDATNGIEIVTYDPEKLELTAVTVHAGYKSVKEGNGEVTIGFVDLDGIAAGEAVATLVFNVKDEAPDSITVTHKEVNDTAPGYQEVLHLESAENPFTDVDASAYYYDAVLWAYENGITAGVTPTTFRPNEVTTRAQAITFIWRAMGEPKATIAETPFEDIDPNAYYYDAVLWAYENGITAGVSETKFQPNVAATRSQVLTFLWRAEGQPGTNIDNPFADVSETAYYYNAVLWAYENGITSGATAATFKPNDFCTRAQAVCFLYRDMAQ